MVIWAIALLMAGALGVYAGWMLCAMGVVGGIMAAMEYANGDDLSGYLDDGDEPPDESPPDDESSTVESCVKTAVIGAIVAIVGALASLTGLGLGITAAIQRLLA